jgi:hypothetical protein
MTHTYARGKAGSQLNACLLIFGLQCRPRQYIWHTSELAGSTRLEAPVEIQGGGAPIIMRGLTVSNPHGGLAGCRQVFFFRSRPRNLGKDP